MADDDGAQREGPGVSAGPGVHKASMTGQYGQLMRLAERLRAGSRSKAVLREAADEIEHGADRLVAWIVSAESWKEQLIRAERKLAERDREIDRLLALVDALTDEVAADDAAPDSRRPLRTAEGTAGWRIRTPGSRG